MEPTKSRPSPEIEEHPSLPPGRCIQLELSFILHHSSMHTQGTNVCSTLLAYNRISASLQSVSIFATSPAALPLTVRVSSAQENT